MNTLKNHWCTFWNGFKWWILCYVTFIWISKRGKERRGRGCGENQPLGAPQGLWKKGLFIHLKIHLLIFRWSCLRRGLQKKFFFWRNGRKKFRIKRDGKSGELEKVCMISWALMTPMSKGGWPKRELLVWWPYLPQLTISTEYRKRKGEEEHRDIIPGLGREREKHSFLPFVSKARWQRIEMGNVDQNVIFPYKAAARPGGSGGSLPWGAAHSAITHRWLCTKAALIKGQTKTAGEGLMEAIKGHKRRGPQKQLVLMEKLS